MGRLGKLGMLITGREAVEGHREPSRPPAQPDHRRSQPSHLAQRNCTACMNEVTAMRLQVLGCGDAFDSGGRFHTCFHVSAGSASFLVDCGASSLVAMRRFGVDPNTIQTVLISHLHGDHFGGLPFLLPQRTGEVRLQFATISRRAVRVRLRIRGHEPLSDLFVRSPNLRQSRRSRSRGTVNLAK